MRILAPVAAPVNPAADEIKPDLGDFYRKSRMLAERFPVVEPSEYVMEIFGEAAMQAPMKVRDGDLDCYRDMPTRRQAFDEALRRGGIFLQYTSHFARHPRDTPETKNMDALFAFTVDLDMVFAEDAAVMLAELYNKQSKTIRMRLVPSFIVNSGTGLHFVYQLFRPLPGFYSNHPAMQTILDGLQTMLEFKDSFGRFGKVDNTSLVQPFRFPGVKTKLGNRAEVFRSGPLYHIETLEEFFQTAIKYKTRDEYAAAMAAKAAIEAAKAADCPVSHEKGESASKAIPVRKSRPAPTSRRIETTGKKVPSQIMAWLENTIERAKREVPEGNRAKACYMLAFLCHLNGVTVDHARIALSDVVDAWASRGDYSRFTIGELEKVLRRYGSADMKSRRFDAVTINQWLGFPAADESRARAKRDGALRERLERAISQKKVLGLEFTTSSLAEELDAPATSISRLVSIKAKGRRIEWKTSKENTALQK